MREFFKKENEKYKKSTENEADSVMLPISEYHGYINALRIIKDRGIQQIDKSQVDENGYRLLRADKKRYYEVENQKIDTYLITRATPYGINISLKEVALFIKQDLILNYGFVNNRTYAYEFSGRMIDEEVTDRDILVRIPTIIEKAERNEELISDENALFEWYLENQNRTGFSINRISANYAQGIYEVSYFATALI